MKNITYLFGAGASAEKLPLVKDLPNKLADFKSFLENNFLENDDEPIKVDDHYDLNLTYSIVRKRLINDIEWLATASEKHSSIDTFAKKLFIRGEKDLLRNLKTLLTIYFSFEQLRVSPDPRYDAFFASIISSSITNLPSNINILSWNYDSQFELSFSEYLKNDNVFKNEQWLRTRNKYKNSKHDDGFGLYKLNGTARFFKNLINNDDYSILRSVSDEINYDYLKRAIFAYQSSVENKFFPSLSFSWERDIAEKSIIDKAARAVQNSNVLVVIGYSFPFFNRDIDKTIIQCMGSLEKVYIQDPYATKLEERFNSFKAGYQEKIDIIPIEKDLDQFFLPPEL
jgi:hypothetical protein